MLLGIISSKKIGINAFKTQIRLTFHAQHSVHPTGGTRRVFRQFAWLEVGSVKTALSRPTHPRVTQAVGTPLAKLGS